MEGRKLIKQVLSGIGIVLVVGYSYFVLNDFMRGPRILISSPQNGFSTTTPAITVVGKAIHANNLTINDAGVPVDLAGNFTSRLILAPGYNIIKIAAKDSYARIIEKTIEINLVGKLGEPVKSTAAAMATTTVPGLETSISTATTTIN